ncbi:MAG: polysaccharide deacetylase family protein [Patescibacteria group bacterium]
MKSKKRELKSFKIFTYCSLAIIFLTSAAYFLKAYSYPPTTQAQTQTEPTNGSGINATHQPLTINHQQFILPILIYHYVEYVTDERDTIRKSLNIQPNTFQNQIDTLKNNGYIFITPSQIAEIESGKLKIEKPIIISFDDGYRDFYTDVFPILEKNNIKAVAYIVPGFLNHLNYMYWDQVKEISQSNLVEIGAHSMHHQSLGRLSTQAAADEINQSKLVLELSLGRQITTFAYPYGHFTDQTVELVRSAGFTSALTTDTGINDSQSDLFTLHRIHPGANTGQSLLNKLE